MNTLKRTTALVALIFAGSAQAFAANAGASFRFGEWNVRTQTADFNFKSSDFSIPGHVTLTRPTGDINADRASGNAQRKLATLYGHVVLHDTQGGIGAISSAGAGSHEPSTLTTDQLTVDSNNKMYTAVGSVHFVQGAKTVDAQRGVLNDRTHDLNLSGNVHIVDGSRAMDAQTVLYNTASGQAHASGNVSIRFPGEAAAQPQAVAPTSKPKGKPKRH